jgi:hypothetical protein
MIGLIKNDIKNNRRRRRSRSPRQGGSPSPLPPSPPSSPRPPPPPLRARLAQHPPLVRGRGWHPLVAVAAPPADVGRAGARHAGRRGAGRRLHAERCAHALLPTAAARWVVGGTAAPHSALNDWHGFFCRLRFPPSRVRCSPARTARACCSLARRDGSPTGPGPPPPPARFVGARVPLRDEEGRW